MGKRYTAYAHAFRGAAELESAKRAYQRQRDNANRRCIEWQITFLEWWAVWSESGHWAQRGRFVGDYCMSRHGDTGPYAVGNVSIKTVGANGSEAGKKSAEMRRRGEFRCGTRIGQGRGYTVVKTGAHSVRYQVMVSRKYVGMFKTEAEALAARAAFLQAKAA